MPASTPHQPLLGAQEHPDLTEACVSHISHQSYPPADQALKLIFAACPLDSYDFTSEYSAWPSIAVPLMGLSTFKQRKY